MYMYSQYQRFPTLSCGRVSKYWVDWLRARKIDPKRLYQADMCVSLWVSRRIEITLKVTSICNTCKPHQLHLEPYIYESYVKGKPRVLWTFSKVRCGGARAHEGVSIHMH